ncbi:MAG: HipA N-terminal domain-containing protein, partial [Candidatus Krumholzibacteria bacterium]|nr:HipA N-terminal domain-containing protein [Candidatus Krumholzibacteria bacterium]
MVDRVKAANVLIWGKPAGAIVWDAKLGFASFEYEPGFLDLGLDLSPLRMPIDRARGGQPVFAFPNLPRETFMGLPGMLADSLPDNFGNRIIDQWLASRGRSADEFSPVERLCYTGRRGMGALEFKPVINAALDESVPLEVEELVELARKILERRDRLQLDLAKDPGDAMLDIIRVGTSAGGNRPKA